MTPLKKILMAVGLAIPTLLVLYLLIVLNWSFAKGEKVGFVHTFGKRGWLSKTWEGELTVFSVQFAANPEKFHFTVRDDEVASQVSRAIGKKVRIRYEEHVGVPTSWFGETQTYVVGVAPVD